MHIDIRDERLRDLVDPDAERDTLSEQFEFIEGPIWHPRQHYLIFSDIPADKLYRWDTDGGVSVYREPSNMANGNTFDRQGRVLSCEHATSRVVRENDGAIEVLASHYDGRELNSPNDIVVGSDGSVYFTDPSYGRREPHGVARAPQLDFRGVYRIDPEGHLALLARDFTQPNGLCLSLDERTLFVADTEERHVRRFQLEEGGVSGGEVFCESPAPDGLKIDSLGNLYAGGPRGVGVYDGAGGDWLGVISTPEFCANFTWGGADLKTLFLTASSGLYCVPVRVPGIPLF